jgi:hypothetical protein
MMLEIGIANEPKTYAEAIVFPDWQEVMKSELESIEKNETYKLVDPPPRCRPVKSKWVFKEKIGTDGNIQYKA